MIKRVISADNVMDTALVRLFVERGLQQLGQIANVTEQGNKGSLTYYVPLLNYNLDMYVLIFHIIRIILCLLNVLHLISPAGSPFVTLWQSITRELSLCGNLSRAQRRVSVTAQLAPRAGGHRWRQEGQSGFTVTPAPCCEPPTTLGSAPLRGPMVSPLGDSYRWRCCTAPWCFTLRLRRGSPSPKATTEPLTWLTKN